MVAIADGKTNRGGEDHIALVAPGRDPLFNLVMWHSIYLGLERRCRGERPRPATLFYNLARDARFGNKLKPATVNKRLKHHLSFVANLMDCGGLTAYCFRVAGVSQALRKGVEARLLKRHGSR